MDSRLLRAQGPRLALLLVLVAGVAAFFLAGAQQALTFTHLVANKNAMMAWADLHPVAAPFAFVGAYLLLGLFGLPGSTALNVTAGLLFDLPRGLLLVVVASTLASTLAFLSFRYLFRGFVQARVQRRFPALEDALRREGVYFVFALRLAPVVPYSVINLVLAVSPVSFGTYVAATLGAMLPRYLLYVYAGTHLGDVQDPDDLLSPSLLAVLAVLALLPLVTKPLVRRVKARLGRQP